MTEISRTALFGKLNSLLYQSIESATVFCKMRGNPYVELVHWLQQILQLQDSDLRRILDHYGIENARLAADFTQSLDSLPRGASSVSDLSAHLEELTLGVVREGWGRGADRPNCESLTLHRQRESFIDGTGCPAAVGRDISK